MYAMALPTLLSGKARCRNAQAWIASTIAIDCSRRAAARRRSVSARVSALAVTSTTGQVRSTP
jgi:hypothetical protein